MNGTHSFSCLMSSKLWFQRCLRAMSSSIGNLPAHKPVAVREAIEGHAGELAPASPFV